MKKVIIVLSLLLNVYFICVVAFVNDVDGVENVSRETIDNEHVTIEYVKQTDEFYQIIVHDKKMYSYPNVFDSNMNQILNDIVVKEIVIENYTH